VPLLPLIVAPVYLSGLSKFLFLYVLATHDSEANKGSIPTIGTGDSYLIGWMAEEFSFTGRKRGPYQISTYDNALIFHANHVNT
jgi:hypothetical protein